MAHVSGGHHIEIEIEDDRLFDEIESLNDAIWLAPITCVRDLVEKVLILKHWVRLGREVEETVLVLSNQIERGQLALAA